MGKHTLIPPKVMTDEEAENIIKESIKSAVEGSLTIDDVNKKMVDSAIRFPNEQIYSHLMQESLAMYTSFDEAQRRIEEREHATRQEQTKSDVIILEGLRDLVTTGIVNKNIYHDMAKEGF